MKEFFIREETNGSVCFYVKDENHQVLKALTAWKNSQVEVNSQIWYGYLCRNKDVKLIKQVLVEMFNYTEVTDEKLQIARIELDKKLEYIFRDRVLSLVTPKPV